MVASGIVGAVPSGSARCPRRVRFGNVVTPKKRDPRRQPSGTRLIGRVVLAGWKVSSEETLPMPTNGRRLGGETCPTLSHQSAPRPEIRHRTRCFRIIATGLFRKLRLRRDTRATGRWSHDYNSLVRQLCRRSGSGFYRSHAASCGTDSPKTELRCDAAVARCDHHHDGLLAA
jgi:hypothetical protein